MKKTMVFACKFQKMLKILCFFKEKVEKTLKIADSIRDLKISLKTVANFMRGVEKSKKKLAKSDGFLKVGQKGIAFCMGGLIFLTKSH